MNGGRPAAIVVLVFLVALAVPLASGHPAAVSAPPFRQVNTQVCACSGVSSYGAAGAAAYKLAAANAPAQVYDEQLGMTFTQDFTSLAYNVTAVEQQDPGSGEGPAYLLNGLTDASYWYQVGLSWNWNPGAQPGSGFDMNYEVFDPNGGSVLPSSGGGGLLALPGPVNDGDSVLLNLYFNSSSVVMVVHDWNTGASAQETYSSMGASSFVGNPQSVANKQGFFTGLMTEWYHPTVYLSNEQEVDFTGSQGLSSAWLWMDEFNPNSHGPGVFTNQTSSPVSFADAEKLQEFSSNGATEYADAYRFITGALPTEAVLTVDYSIKGGGSGYSPPVLTYVSGGKAVNAALTTSPSTYNVDPGTTWNVTPTLAGSTNSERWQAAQPTSGTASTAETLSLVYYNQYSASVTFSIVGAPPPLAAVNLRYTSLGTETTPLLNESTTIVWMDVGSSYFVSNSLSSPSQQERWEVAGGNNGTASGPVTLAPVYYQQFLVKASYTIAGGGSPPSPTINYTSFAANSSKSLSTSPQSLWPDAGSTYAVSASVASSSQERWSTNTTSGTISQGLALSPVYHHQYYVTLQPSNPGAGNISTPSGWYDAGSPVSATASANSGWQFEFWQQNNGSTSSSVSSQVSGPINDTAVFYPGLTITPGNDVMVMYSYSGMSLTAAPISSGQPATVYVPPGGISLSARSTSLLYSFSHWSGASSSGSSSISLTVSSPEALTTVSGYSYLVIGIIASIVIVVIAAVVVLASRGRKTGGSPAA